MEVKFNRAMASDPNVQLKARDWLFHRRMTAEEEKQFQKQVEEGRIATYVDEDGTEECRR